MQHAGDVRVSFREVCRIDEAAAEESCRLRFFAGNLGGSAKILKLLDIRPGHLRGDAIDLPEGPVDAEPVIFVESSEAVSRFQGGVKRTGVMIALVGSGLIDRRSRERRAHCHIRERERIALDARNALPRRDHTVPHLG